MRELHLFAGSGGGILGGVLLGHVPVCAVELDQYCRRVLLQRQRDGVLPWFPIWDDVTTFDGKPWRGRVDIVCGGFPCQDISAAGRGAGITGKRSGLWSEMARIIGEVRPEFVFVENSPLLVGRGLAVVLGDLASMGFDARWGVLGAHHAGAPHKRDRIWILANAMPSGQRRIKREEKIKSHALSDCKGQRCEEGQQIRRNKSKEWASCSSADVANTDCERLEAQRPKLQAAEPCERGEDVADANGERRRCQTTGQENAEDAWQSSASQIRFGWWDSEPRLGRVAHGVAHRVDRLKAIGNGQVPTVARLAWSLLRGGQ